MHQPKLLLLDEPTAGVDPKARREFWDEIHELAADGMTVLVSTHYMDEAERCHRIVYIAYGTVVARGTVDEVIEASGLHTIVVRGGDTAALVRTLKDADGIEQVAPFGNDLHVVGQDPVRLERSVNAAIAGSGATAAEDVTSLEDVFIRLMADAPDNFKVGAADRRPVS
jgi:ABC-2 type transport system ATP-binding protein